jgi:predicted permease
MMRLRWPFRNRNQDLADEIQAHLSMAQHDRELQGESGADAERSARVEFGNRTLVAEVTRQMWGWRWADRLWQDIRYGAWMMRRSRAFTAVAVLSLAIGIGANTAVFTLINAVMLQSLPVHDPAHLVLFYDGISTGEYSGNTYFSSDFFSTPSWKYLQAHTASVEDLCAFRQGIDRVAMRVAGSAPGEQDERPKIDLVSGNYFDLLGVRPALGRSLRPEDDVVGAPPVAVISYPFWQNRFHLGNEIIGQTVLLNNVAFTVVGVAAREFFGVRVQSAPDFWLPLAFQPRILQRESWLEARDVYWLNLMGRLKPGVTVQQAGSYITQQLQDFYSEQAGSHPSESTLRQLHGVRVTLKPGGTGISGLRYLYSEPLHLLMAVVGVVLLIACANIATLLLARAAARRQEFRARIALGASPGRIVHQVLTESVLLSFVGGLAGAALAWWSLKGLIVLLNVPSVVKVRPDPTVLAFTAAITILTGILFGLVPAVRFGRPECKRIPDMRSPQALIVVQVAFSFVLLLGSALLTRSLVKLEYQDAGFNRTNVLVVHMDPKLAGYQGNDFFPLYRQLDERLNQIPGVISASSARYTPVSGNSSSGSVGIENYTPHSGELMNIHRVEVGPRFFDTLKIPILLGRAIEPRDTPASVPVCVVNSSFAAAYFPNQSPIGRKLSLGSPFHAPGFEIAGVVADSRYYDLRDKAKPMVFLAAWQLNGDFKFAGDLLLRTASSAPAITPEVRRVLKSINPKLTASDVSTLDQQIDESLKQQKLLTNLCSAFGITALLLSSLGIYGTIAYSVTRRTLEIGIRMAVGAPRERILWMMIRESVVLTVIGLCAGLPLAFIAVRWIKSFLFEVTASDSLAMAAAVVLVSTVALTAGYLPALRATKIEPMRALKYE